MERKRFIIISSLTVADLYSCVVSPSNNFRYKPEFRKVAESIESTGFVMENQKSETAINFWKNGFKFTDLDLELLN